MSLSRADRSDFSAWWWTVDRLALAAMLALIAIGLMLAFAASPAITGGPMSAGDFHYAVRQIAFAAIAACILGASSLLSLQQIKIVAAFVFAVALIGSVAVLFGGSEVLGARRELQLGFFALQPSEFLKPGFAVLAGAILADRVETKTVQAGHHVPLAVARLDRAAVRSPMSDRNRPAARAMGDASVLRRTAAGLDRAARHGLSFARRLCLSGVPACAPSHRAVHAARRTPAIRRASPQGIRAWGLDGGRSRRGHDQISYSRRPFRFYLRGGGRGIRAGPVRDHRRAVLLSHRAHPAPRGKRARRGHSPSSRARASPSSPPSRRSSIWASQ